MKHTPGPLDAMAAAPDHHRVLLENDQVRVLDTRLAPGETTPIHEHGWPAVLHVLSWSDFVRVDREGNVVLDSRAAGMTHVPGTIVWGPALMPHAVRNVGERELHVIAIEIKQSA
jgi:predicted metal-dependent enzyme (double-stranded beta helix superfamily)